MKKLFLLPLMMFALVGCNQPAGGGAKEIAFTAEDFSSASQTAFTTASLQKDGLTISFTKVKYAPAGTSQAGEAFPAQLRVTKADDSTMTITGKKVTKVDFVCALDYVGSSSTSYYGPDGFTYTVGKMSNIDKGEANQKASWAGESENLVFTASGHQVRIISFTVTVA